MNTTAVHLAIFDDHQIVIDGLKLLLQNHPHLYIDAEANTAEEMIELLAQKKIDILLTDITTPHGMNGYELALYIRKQMPPVKILALSMSEEGGMISKMIEHAHIDGYIPKAAGQKELLLAIDTIASGKTYFSPDVLEQYELFKTMRNENVELHLTSRELEIIQCIMKYYSNKQIADALFISERTVETHRKNIYRKTSTKGEASLIQFVKEHNIIS